MFLSMSAISFFSREAGFTDKRKTARFRIVHSCMSLSILKTGIKPFIAIRYSTPSSRITAFLLFFKKEPIMSAINSKSLGLTLSVPWLLIQNTGVVWRVYIILVSSGERMEKHKPWALVLLQFLHVQKRVHLSHPTLSHGNASG